MYIYLFIYLLLCLLSFQYSHPQGPRSFWSAPRITTSGQVQWDAGSDWLCKHNRMRPEPIRFFRLDSEHAQSDGKSVNRRLPVLEPDRESWFLVLTKRSAASGDEDEFRAKWRLFFVQPLFTLGSVYSTKARGAARTTQTNDWNLT